MLTDVWKLFTPLLGQRPITPRGARSKAEVAVVRSVQLVGLSPHLATAVVVLSNGVVESEPIELAESTTDALLAVATSNLNATLVGFALNSANAPIPSGNAKADALVRQVINTLATRRSDESVFVGGASSMAEAFDAVDIVRSVLHTLEQQYIVVSLDSDMLNRGLSVSIGAEHGIETLVAC